MISKIFPFLLLLLHFSPLPDGQNLSRTATAETIVIPIGGNTFLTVVGDGDKVTAEGITQWKSQESLLSTFFRLGHPHQAQLKLQLGKQEHDSEIEVKIGQQKRKLKIQRGEATTLDVGMFQLLAGYHQVEFRGIQKGVGHFGHIEAILIHPINGEEIEANFVRDNIDNRFYWGRRGPSVHLSYELPEERDFQWFYSEITVPVGEDPNGSYYMANGFAEGYFGMQANSDTERRVLFSVWSPFATDNPNDIPENQRIKLLKKGKDVYTGEFGNEGSGGQSFLRYPWITGNTYGFLNSVTPDGKGNTVYTAYFFAPELGEWQLIASFLRPQTDTWYKRPHSFLENFLDVNGYKGRKAYYTNQWLRDTTGTWVELDKAKFSADDIGRRGYRKDFAGGEEKEGFFLQNGGFFNHFTELGLEFRRKKNNKAPDIDMDAL